MPAVSTTRPTKTTGHPTPKNNLRPLEFRRHPALFAAACFASGIFASTHWQTPALRCTTAVLLLCIAWLATFRASRLQLFATAAVWAALGWTCAGLQTHAAMQMPIDNFADALSRNVSGTVTHVRPLPQMPHDDSDESPSEFSEEASAHKAPLWIIDLQADHIEDVMPDTTTMRPVAGGVQLLLESASPPATHCGDRIEAPMRLSLPPRYRDPGVWQYAEYLAENNIRLRASTHAASLRILEHGKVSMQCRLQAAQAWAAAHIATFAASRTNTRLPDVVQITASDAGVLNAMLFGDRSLLLRSIRLRFERTGTFHLLVVAGMHVALIAMCMLWLMEKLGAGRVTATLITICITGWYALLTGFAAPVQRAFWMIVIVLLVRMMARRHTTLNALGIAAGILLIAKPSSLQDASFQMTTLAVLAISGIAIPIAERTFMPYAHAAHRIGAIALDAHLAPSLAQFRVQIRMLAEAYSSRHARRIARCIALFVRLLAWCAELILLSAISELLMSLPMMVYFHRFTPFALPANILCVTLLAPLMIAAAALLFATWIHPAVAILPAAITALLLHFITGILQHIGTLPGADLRTPPPEMWKIAIILALWAFCIWAIRFKRSCAGLVAPALGMSFMLLVLPIHQRLQPNALELTAIDVGQGDSLLIASPEGKTMLVDAGGPVGRAENAQSSNYDIGEEVVSPYLWQRGIRRLDIVALTHAHSDHMGGMAAILRNFRPRELWISVDASSPQFQQLLQTAREYNIPVRRLHHGDRMDWSNVAIHVLAPMQTGPTEAAPRNNDSLVMRLAWHKASVLLEGDAERPSEDAMLQDAPELHSTLLKVGHHGSRTSTTPEFLAAVTPAYALISDGRGNHFGHPRIEVIQRLQDAGVRVYRTDMLGATTFLFSADGTASITTYADSQR